MTGTWKDIETQAKHLGSAADNLRANSKFTSNDYLRSARAFLPLLMSGESAV